MGKAEPHRWSWAEVLFLKRNAPGRSAESFRRLFNRRFKLSLTLSQIENAMYRHGIRHGTAGAQFKAGQTPWNKGMKGLRLCPEHEFKPGQKPWNTKPVGAEATTKGGYVKVKTKQPDHWKKKHVLVWEKAAGRKVPRGCVVIFADGDKRNFEEGNLLLVSRGSLAVMNREGLVAPGDGGLTRQGKLAADLKILIRKRSEKKGAKKNNSRG
jgi:hypothetical protein